VLVGKCRFRGASPVRRLVPSCPLGPRNRCSHPRIRGNIVFSRVSPADPLVLTMRARPARSSQLFFGETRPPPPSNQQKTAAETAFLFLVDVVPHAFSRLVTPPVSSTSPMLGSHPYPWRPFERTRFAGTASHPVSQNFSPWHTRIGPIPFH